MTKEELKEVLELHRKWLQGLPDGKQADLSEADLSEANLSEANLYGANLYGADLYGADLSEADLSEANLSEANLYGANLYGADLSRADLSGANLSGADLYGANLSGANLSGANLSRADLSEADLSRADLSRANLSGANLSGARGFAFQIPQEGELVVFKKLDLGAIAKLRVPPEAKRTASMVGRKCRAEYAEVLEITGRDGKPRKAGRSTHDITPYRVGEVVRPDSYDDDPRVECTHGIHFFLTREEAENY